jgi:GntR family transcriptional regulator
MLFYIDFDSATAVYRQLVDQVRYAVAAGTLQPRDPLPAIRPLAIQLHLNRNTVAKAYSELEALGVIKTIPGKGCFVEAVNSPFTLGVRQKFLAKKIDAALVAAHQLQVDAKAFSVLLKERANLLERRHANPKSPEPPESLDSPDKEVLPTKATPSSTATSTPTIASNPVASVSIPDTEAWSPSMD